MEKAARKQAEEKHNELAHEHQEVLARIRQLSELLPVCTYCEERREDQGYWRQIETYISEHAKALFPLGLCPACARRLSPQLELAGEN